MPESTTAIGRRAEAAAASFLEYKGCYIVGQNWRTRWCEIDIIAKRNNVLYFCEVKYRRHAQQGDGLAYITTAKLRQMSFAANYWVGVHRWAGEYQLCAIAVAGDQFQVTEVIKDVITS
jgi:uncharacterized protein (TIGR00252 family)